MISILHVIVPYLDDLVDGVYGFERTWRELDRRTIFLLVIHFFNRRQAEPSFLHYIFATFLCLLALFRLFFTWAIASFLLVLAALRPALVGVLG